MTGSSQLSSVYGDHFISKFSKSNSRQMSSFDPMNLKQLEGLGTIIHQTEMPSTNDVAKHTLLNDPSEITFPLLVICDRQTSGRGQPGKTWQSDEHSLTFTWCVPVESVPSANQTLLPLIAGVSVCEAIESKGISDAKLKWPNDVLIQRRKVCGILVEKIVSGDNSWLLVGIGINVNQTKNETDALDQSNSAFPPGSLRVHRGKEVEVQSLLRSICHRLAENASKKTQWSERCNSLFDFRDEQINFTKPDGGEVVGTFQGVDSMGKLRLDVNGELQLFASGQIGIVAKKL
jgi:BirA family biotin operon repressor/biotin-[acetyl-CoA-carboxylase] ligase